MIHVVHLMGVYFLCPAIWRRLWASLSQELEDSLLDGIHASILAWLKANRSNGGMWFI